MLGIYTHTFSTHVLNSLTTHTHTHTHTQETFYDLLFYETAEIEQKVGYD